MIHVARHAPSMPGRFFFRRVCRAVGAVEIPGRGHCDRMSRRTRTAEAGECQTELPAHGEARASISMKTMDNTTTKGGSLPECDAAELPRISPELLYFEAVNDGVWPRVAARMPDESLAFAHREVIYAMSPDEWMQFDSMRRVAA